VNFCVRSRLHLTALPVSLIFKFLGMKIYLKRQKNAGILNKTAFQVPAYKGFFRTEKGDYFVIGWLKDNSSDLDLTITKVNEQWLNKNKWNMYDYSKWRETVK